MWNLFTCKRQEGGEVEAAAEGPSVVTAEMIQQVSGSQLSRFDKGDLFYEQISALHKAVRGSDPDASLYWCQRMFLGGCDPLYLARRLVRMASEDIGNADPRALQLALNAWDVQQRLGSPEGSHCAGGRVSCGGSEKQCGLYGL